MIPVTRTKAPRAQVVPQIRGKPIKWPAPLPPNRGSTEAEDRHAVIMRMKEQRLPLRRGTNPVSDQKTVRHGREPTQDPTRAVSRYAGYHLGSIGCSTKRRIRGPNN